MPTMQEVTTDPNFLALAPADKIHVMSRIDPRFSSLSPEDQQHVAMKLSPIAAGAEKNLANIQAGKDIPQGALNPNQGTFMQGVKESAVPSFDSLNTLAKAATGNPVAMFDIGRNVVGAQVAEGKRAKDAYLRGDILEGIGHSAAAAMPVIGPAAANAGEDIKEGNIAQGLGKAAGLIGSVVLPGAVAKGAGKVIQATGPAMRAAAVEKYISVLDPAGKNPELAREIATKFIDEGVTLPNKNTRAAMGEIAEKKAVAVDTDTPILKRATEFIDPALESGAGAKARVVSALEKKYPMSEVITDPQTGDIVVNQIRHPSMWDKANELSKIAKHIETTATNGTLTNEALRNLLSDYGYYADKGGAFEGVNTNEVRLPADAHAHSAISDVIREDPAAAAALDEKSTWIQAKDKLAPGVTQGKPYGEGVVKRAVIKGAASGLAHIINPAFGQAVTALLGASEINTFARSIMNSPAWRTWSAVQKANFAQSAISGDIGNAVSTAARADQAATGLSDDAQAAMSHVTIPEMPKVYNGGAVYVDPDGNVTPIPQGARP